MTDFKQKYLCVELVGTKADGSISILTDFVLAAKLDGGYGFAIAGTPPTWEPTEIRLKWIETDLIEQPAVLNG